MKFRLIGSIFDKINWKLSLIHEFETIYFEKDGFFSVANEDIVKLKKFMSSNEIRYRST